MTQHFVLSINPTAKYDWEKLSLTNPLDGETPDLKQLIASIVGNPGDYLISVEINVQVLAHKFQTTEPDNVLHLAS